MSQGFRINPTPQQAGTQTMQQAIYQAHNSSCGVNTLIHDPILVVDNNIFKFQNLKDLLFETMNQESTIALLETVKSVGTTYLADPSDQNRLFYLNALLNWARQLYTESLTMDPISGYQYVLTVYDYNGNTIWDSGTPDLTPTTNTDLPDYVQVPLIRPNPLTGNPPLYNLYGISNTPAAISWIDGNNLANTNGALAQHSAYLINQAAMPESTMAIASLLTDPANTRVYGFPRYGFSARQNTTNALSSNLQFGQLGFYCCYLFSIYSNPVPANNNTSTMIEYMFVRLGLAQDPISLG